MTELDFVLVTGNSDKLLEAQRILGATLKCAAIDLPEIQSLDISEVLAAKADAAWEALQRPLVVEETSLELHALNAFPGPLVKWMLQSVGPEGIARTAIQHGDAGATARCHVQYRDAERRIEGKGVDPGRLVLPARGGDGFGWDVVFCPEASDRTYAELGGEEKDRRGHRGNAWRDLLRKLQRAGLAPR